MSTRNNVEFYELLKSRIKEKVSIFLMSNILEYTININQIIRLNVYITKDMKQFIVAFIFLAFVTSSYAQKIKKHEIDKFTKEEFVQTSSVKLFDVFGFMRRHKFECYIEKHGDIITMPAIMGFDCENIDIDKNSGVIFLLDNDETIELLTEFIGDTDRYNRFSTCFKLSPEDVEKLRNNKVVSVRINYVGGHYDAEVKEKNQSKISNMLNLVLPKL